MTKDDTAHMIKQEVEDTLIVFKPDALQRGIVGEILSRFERVGLKIVGIKMLNPDKAHYTKHYGEIGKMITRRGEKAFMSVVEYMLAGPVIAVVLEGVGAVALVRKIVGSTEPQVADMGTIRGDYSHMTFVYADKNHKAIPNLIHASGNVEEANLEISHWFANSEIYEYSILNEKFTR